MKILGILSAAPRGHPEIVRPRLLVSDQKHLVVAYYESACRDPVIHALSNVQGNRRAALTLAK